MSTHRRLVYSQETGTARVKVHAEINSNGDLLLTGHDLGTAPQDAYGDSDLEYTVRVPAAQKDRVLVDLLAQTFSTPTSASDFKKWLASKGIPHHFETW